jgi:3-hydroxy acid dehydrogenase / malonic semialdehyde reductase
MAEASSRNAVVTGAAGGMGRAITRALLESGRTRTGIILTRYRGDLKKEKDHFDQFKMALDPVDIARSIVFALDQPPHVQIAEMMILPVNRY